MSAEFHPLQPGEPIGVVALSGPVDPAQLEAGLTVLRGWEHPIVEASNLRRKNLYLAGSDDERLAGLEEVVDQGVRWIMAARGGYGSTRLLPSTSIADLRRRGIRLIGFSDLTAFLNPLAGEGGAIQIHGPMVAAGLARPHNARRLHSVLTGEMEGEVLYRFPQSSVIRSGSVAGPALGGNLTMLVSLLGTPWEPDFDGCVLFLEEVSEPLYRLDRLLTHFRCSGRLRNVKALIGGSLRGCRPASERSQRWRELLEESAPSGAPIVAGLPFGHGAANMAFPIGASIEVDTQSGCVRWS